MCKSVQVVTKGANWAIGGVLVMALLAWALPLQADNGVHNCYWAHAGVPGDWSGPGNWNPHEPTSENGILLFISDPSVPYVSVTQPGEICTKIRLGDETFGSSARLDIVNGDLTATDWTFVGYSTMYNHMAHMYQSGGTFNANMLAIGYGYPTGTLMRSPGTYHMDGGVLNCNALHISYYSNGNFIQTGGLVKATDGVYISFYAGYDNQATGNYDFQGGRLETKLFYVGGGYQGNLNINSGTTTYISELLEFMSNANFTTSGGVLIHMNDAAIPPTKTADFNNRTSSSSQLAGLENVTLLFDASVPADTAYYEVAGKDLGDAPEGFADNFVLAELSLGPNARVNLRDSRDNQPAWSGHEALYVKHLRLAAGSILYRNCYSIYYQTLENLGGTIEEGTNCAVLNISTDKASIPSNGSATAVITAQLLLYGGAAPNQPVTLQTDLGYLIDPATQNPVTQLTLNTDSQGRVIVIFRAADEAALATVTAEYPPRSLTDDCTVDMVEYGLYLMAVDEARYLSVPGREPDNPVIRSFGFGGHPEVTRNGVTEIPMMLELSGVDVGGQVIELSSVAQDQTAELGHGAIQFPAEVTTDSQGQAFFNVSISTLNEYKIYNVGELPNINVVDLTARVKTDPAVTDSQELPVVENYELIIDHYENDIEHGLIWTDNDYYFHVLWSINPALATSVRSAAKGYAGLLTDALVHIAPQRFWEMEIFTCGGYQRQVLYLLDSLRLSSTESWIMNGFDFGPIMQLGGAHQAAAIWTHERTCWDVLFSTVLDPWPTQDPKDGVYDWFTWLATIGLRMPFVGQVLELNTDAGSSDEYINSHYPNKSLPYPPEPYWSYTLMEPPQPALIVDCPVNIMFTDGSGLRTGNLTNGDPNQPQFIAEIPGLDWMPFVLPDGTLAWLFKMPENWLDLEMTGYDDGDFTLYLLDGTGAATAYTQGTVAAGQTAHVVFDPAVTAAPAVVFADGRTILPDDILNLGVWHYDGLTEKSSTLLTLTNNTAVALHAPLWLVIENVFPASVSLADPNGVTPQGQPYLDLSSLLSGGVLTPNQSVSRTITFSNPDRIRFDVDGELRGLTDTSAAATARLAARFVGLTPCESDGYPTYDLAENNSSQWEFWAAESQPENSVVLDDTNNKIAGSASIWGMTDGGFDTCLRYPLTQNAAWDLTHAGLLHLSLFVANGNEFQEGPWIRLLTDADNFFEYRFYQDGGLPVLLNDCRVYWQSYQIPLDAPDNENNGWRRTVQGTPNIAQINYLEIHADTWDSGFLLWTDDLRFAPPMSPEADLNADCTVDMDDLMIFSEKWTQCDCTPTVCAGADVNGDTRVDLRDYAQLAQNWLEEGM